MLSYAFLCRICCISSSIHLYSMLSYDYYRESHEWDALSVLFEHPPIQLIYPKSCNIPTDKDPVMVTSSVQAVILCMAAILGDDNLEASDFHLDGLFALSNLVLASDHENPGDLILEILLTVTRQKFEQNKDLKDVLLKTGDHVLAACHWGDCLWSTGIDEHDPHIEFPHWVGDNILGWALMQVRTELSHSSEIEVNLKESNLENSQSSHVEEAISHRFIFGAILCASAAIILWKTLEKR
eukprot:m.61510 g.61510  ORF g.61510 m.61510 type:complete len:240 (+) comp11419_c0_seq7:770-1489(+)